jgi:hypothetical protein
VNGVYKERKGFLSMKVGDYIRYLKLRGEYFEKNCGLDVDKNDKDKSEVDDKNKSEVDNNDISDKDGNECNVTTLSETQIDKSDENVPLPQSNENSKIVNPMESQIIKSEQLNIHINTSSISLISLFIFDRGSSSSKVSLFS